MKRTGYFLLLLIMFSVFSCGEEVKQGERRKVLGSSKSAPYELLVVCNKAWYKGDAGKKFRDMVNTIIPMMPQDEPIFKVICINTGAFSKTFMTFGCIIFVNIDNKYSSPEYIKSKNVYAKPQQVVTLNSPDYAGIDQLVDEHGEEIIDLMESNEIKRAVNSLKKNYSRIVGKAAKEMFGCDWHMPDQITMIKKGKNFFWASSGDNVYNACMYSYPWTSNDTFTKDYFIQKRDSFMRKNIEGEEWGQYVTTNPSLVKTKERMVDGHYVQEVRGIWEMTNDLMAGPFVSYVQLDSIKKRIIVTEGFVYLPNKEKKKMIHALEAGLRTLKMENEE